MTLSFLPIVARELRVASRKKATFLARCSAVVIVFIIGAWLFLMMSFAPPAMISMALFRVLSGAGLFYALMSGVHFTAGAIAQEKSDGTLGLLFLTDLKGYDVVLGKLFATSLNAFYGLLGMLPMLAVPLLIGGVTLGEVSRMSLVVVNAMLFSLTACLFVSSMCASVRRATGYALLLLGFFTVILPTVGESLADEFPVLSELPLYLSVSPFYAFLKAFDGAYRVDPGAFWKSVGMVHALAWIFLVAASRITPRSWQDKPVGVKVGFRAKLAGITYGKGERREKHRRELLAVNPFYWLSSRSLTKPAQVWALLIVFAAVWFATWADSGFDPADTGVHIMTALLLNILLKGWFTNECTRQISEDRRNGALELVLSTPLSVKDILQGQRLALQRQFLAPMTLVLLVYMLFWYVAANPTSNSGERGVMVWLWGLGITIFVADIIAIFWVGIYMALKIKRPQQASSATSTVVLVLPWVLFAGAMIFVVNQFSMMRSPSHPEYMILGAWALTALGVDAAAIAIARRCVLDNFRRMATAATPGRGRT